MRTFPHTQLPPRFPPLLSPSLLAFFGQFLGERLWFLPCVDLAKKVEETKFFRGFPSRDPFLQYNNG